MPDAVAVIGCGPGGMFLCHALERKRQELLDSGESFDHLPDVTVFERASSPGGVWRSESINLSDIREEKKEAEFDYSNARTGTQMVTILYSFVNP
jgi:cation diffusion facilitator CzcD-associated flavoprotein CzcO